MPPYPISIFISAPNLVSRLTKRTALKQLRLVAFSWVQLAHDGHSHWIGHLLAHLLKLSSQCKSAIDMILSKAPKVELVFSKCLVTISKICYCALKYRTSTNQCDNESPNSRDRQATRASARYVTNRSTSLQMA